MIIAGVLGYSAGTLPSADIAARLSQRGADLRAEGSGNPGATNAAAVLGARWGAAVLLADIAKGVAATGLGRGVAGSPGADMAGAAAVLGHCYPAWNGFRGGKGVATSVGQVVGTFPAYLPVDVVVAGASMAVPWWKQRAFAANTVASLTWVVAATWWWRRGRAGPSLPLAAAASSTVIFSRFTRNPT